MKFRIIASILIVIVCGAAYWYTNHQSSAPSDTPSSDSSTSYKLD